MQNYELTIVLPEKSAAAKKKTAKDLVEKLVKTYEGKLGGMEDWGSKQLFYVIEGESTGVFLHFQIELNTDKVNALRENLKRQDGVIRFLLIKAAEEKENK